MFGHLDEQRRRNRGIPDVERRTGYFVRLESNGFAVVNVADSTVTVPCVGFTPPIPNSVVQLERRNGQMVVLGPAVATPGTGVIKATGSPKCTVTVAGVDYTYGYLSTYTPVVGDQVIVDQVNLVILGKITAPNAATAPNTTTASATSPLPGAPVLAVTSGQFRSRWQSNDVRASDTVSGAWVYGDRVKNALAGATVTGIQIYLPLRKELGVCNIGTHGSSSLPAGWTGISGAVPLSPRGGWVSLPTSFAGALAAGGGIAVVSGNGDNQWAGTQADGLSGALRFTGTR